MSNLHDSTLRLIYPQWQGGDIAAWFPDLSPKEAAQGYILGAQILNLLVDSIHTSANGAVVNVAQEFSLNSAKQRIVEDGIIDKSALLRQSEAALSILNARKPSRVLTLGGECAVSVPSFCYLANLYADDVALLWIDAHPDIGLPYDDFYKGYHAMAMSAIIGRGGLRESFALPASLKGSRALLVGLHSNEAEHYASRQKEFGLKSLLADEVDCPKILEWLKSLGCKKVMIHLDLDVLDAKELYIAVGNTGKLSIAQVSQIIQNVAREYDVVGLSIAEHFPKAQIKLRGLLQDLPLIKES